MSASNRIHDSRLIARWRASVSARRDSAVIACWDAMLQGDLAAAGAASPGSVPIIQQLSALDDAFSPTSAFLEQLEQELASVAPSPSGRAQISERRPDVTSAPQFKRVSNSTSEFPFATRWLRLERLLVPVSILLITLMLVGIWQRDRLLPEAQPVITAPLASGALQSNGDPVQALTEITFDPNSIDSAMPSSVAYIEVDVMRLGPGETATIGASDQHGVNGFLVLDGLIEVHSPSTSIVRTKDGQTIQLEAGRQRTLSSGDAWIGSPDAVSPITTFSDSPSRFFFFYVGSETGPGGAVIDGIEIRNQGYGYGSLEMTYGGGPLTLRIDRLLVDNGQTAQLELEDQEIAMLVSATAAFPTLRDGTPTGTILAYSGHLIDSESPRGVSYKPSDNRPNDAYLVRIAGFTSTASTPLALGSGRRR